jgi:phage tail sheath protein FI
VLPLAGRVDGYAGLSVDPGDDRFVATVLGRDGGPDEHGLVWLEVLDPPPAPAALLTALLSPGGAGTQLVGGSDGGEPTPAALATGLAALGKVDEVALVATPDAGVLDVDASAAAAAAIIAHCEEHPYRFGLVDPPSGLDVDGVLAFRARFDSSRAAIYFPWLLVDDASPPPGGPPSPLAVPPSGALAGICARVDSARGVHEAPANEPVLGIVGLAAQVSTTDQERLNPAGVNAIRSFPGRGILVWGARTMSSDSEWRYVSIRRLFVFLEHSIDKGTQWAVFEPNGEPLWASVRRAVEDFLLAQWQSGVLLGRTPDEAYFVRCDRSTMTQDDLDNGRLVVLIAVAAVRPAEFVLLRIGQWTADARG